MHESLMKNWIILYSDAWFGFGVLEGFFGGEGIGAGATCYVLCTSKLNLESKERAKAVASAAWKQTGLLTIKVGDSKDGRPHQG